ncbi:MAG TPA: sterol desaturase family protein [Burkholderiales bacterium]|nr:sterol desaturase family protein [Burkholderiales bacterium]
MLRWAGLLVVGFIAALLVLERTRPLRRAVEPGARRRLRNAAIGALTACELAAVERPVIRRVMVWTAERRWGLLRRMALPRWVETLAAVVLLDYTLYLWHILLHRVPLLWRFHLAHHVDRDLDASTALRFHVGEFLASVPWRAAQVALIGVTPRALELWQQLTALEVLFHHSNVRLPLVAERALGLLVVTPRLHGIHHSTERSERDSNFSSGLTVWDRLHGTWRDDVPQQRITIGVSPYGRSADLSVKRTLLLPFATGEQRPKPSLPRSEP